MRALRKQDEGTRQSPEGHGLRAKGHKKPVSAPKYLWLCGHPVSQDVKRIAACRCTPICGPPSAQQALYRLKGTHFLPGFSWECHYLFSLLTASEHTVFMHLHSVTSWAKTARNDTLQAASKEQGSGTEYLTLKTKQDSGQAVVRGGTNAANVRLQLALAAASALRSYSARTEDAPGHSG